MMKYLLMLLVLIASFTEIKAQMPSGSTDTTIHKADAIDRLPNFPGGMKAFYNYVGANIEYPKIALQNGRQGTVIVSFVIEQDGSLSNIAIKRGVWPEINQEAIRVVRQSPKWIPAAQYGKNVRVAYSVPIQFSLR